MSDAAPPPKAPGDALDGPARHARIKQLFNAVCDLPDTADQRAVLQALGAEEDLQAEVLRILAPPGGATRFSGSVAQTAVQWLGSQLQPGDRLGAWTLLRPVGEGGMGRVFLAERSDGHYQQQAAVKLLLGWSGAEALLRLTRERQILARLNHPHIAKLLDGGSTPAGQPYLVMEYADGDTIDVWCARHQSPLADRLALFDAVCGAVAHAHRHGVVHCDIKPANVLVNAEGRVMLLDFGIARLEGQHHDAAAGMSAGYASPEQEAGQAPGPASDIFSLGRLLADLLRPVALPHRLADALAAVVARATAHEPALRHETAAALQRELQRLRSTLEGDDADVGLPIRPRRLRRAWAWALAGVATLGAMAALTGHLLGQVEQARLGERQAREAAARAVAAGRALPPRPTGNDGIPPSGAGR